jgi:hypothetical protein
MAPKCWALNVGHFVGLDVWHVQKYPTGFVQSRPETPHGRCENPDFGAVRGVKIHIISGIRR